MLIKFLCALANDDGDVKSGLLAPKLKDFSLIVHGERLHWLYTSNCDGELLSI